MNSFFTKRFGYGSMKDESDVIKEELFSAVKSTNRYDAAVNMMNAQLVNGLVGWLDKCFTRYPPQAFHYKMSQGFDFVQDMQFNHGTQFKLIMGIARRIRKRIQTDTDTIYNVIIRMLERKGYAPTQQEKMKIYRNIDQVIRMIYG